MLYDKPGRSGWSLEPDAGISDEPYHPAIVGGRYRVTGVLSRRQSTDVVNAVDVREDRQVVAKRVRFPDRSTGHRLRKAQQVLTGLRVPEVASVRDLLEGRQESWLIWDRLSGLNLHDYRQTLPLSNSLGFEARWQHVSPLFESVLHALEQLHRSELPHLDVKPSNVLVGVDGRAVLVDLGVAEDLAGGDDDDGRGEVYRSDLGFVSPEQVSGSQGELASDQWALGALLYFLLSGSAPVPVNYVAHLETAYGRGQAKPLRQHIPDVPEEFESILVRMLAWNPLERLESLSAVRSAFEQHALRRGSVSEQLWSTPSAPMVGRGPFITFFEKRLRELVGGTSSVVQVIADPGIGKTRLLAAWEEAAREVPGVTLYSSSCLPGQPRAVLDGWFQPPKCEIGKPPPEDLVEQAITGLDGPTVLLFDALEEVDSISWARIHRAAAQALSSDCTTPLLVVLAGRNLPALSPRVDTDNSHFFNVALPPLSARDVAELIRPEGSGDDDIAVRDSAAEMLCEEARGIPGLLMATFLNEQREGRMDRDGRRWVARVGQSIDEQMTRPRPTQLDHILSQLASLGTDLELDIALRCLPQTMDEVLDALDWAAQKDLVSYRVVGDRWFLTICTRARSLTPEQSDGLMGLNRRVANCLETLGEQGGLSAERTALHWRAASEVRFAGQAYLRAARANLRIGSSSEARRLAQIGRNLLPGS